jgi:proteasome lid subunit RPN8/RPN11
LIAAGAEIAAAHDPLGAHRAPTAAQAAALSERESNLCGGLDFSRLPSKILGPVSRTRSHQFQMIVRQTALNHVHAHGDETPNVEVCGVMVGDVYRDQTGPFVLIEEVVEGRSANGSVGQVTFTADTWQHIQSVMDAKHPGKKIVGWYHTHPGHGIFLSDMDLFLHKNFFSMPWQAAMVYDPQQAEDGIFGWHRGAGADRADMVIEADTAATPFGPRDMRSGEKRHVPTPEEIAAKDAAEAAEAAEALKDMRCGRHPIIKLFLATMSLGLFVVMGYLLGNLIIDLHIKLPPLPFKLPFFH